MAIVTRVPCIAQPLFFCFMVVCVSLRCVAADTHTPTYTLILEPPVTLGPLQGVPANIGYTSVSGAIADLNGDGAPDIVIGINGTPPAIYLNNGTTNPFHNVSGVFVSPPPGPYSAGNSWGAAVVADINADGHPDVAIAGFNAPNMIYLNNGSSVPFHGASGIAIGSQDISYTPAFGDVNGDGFVDLAVANTNHVPSRLYLTQGAPLTSGTYSTIQIGTDIGYGQDARIIDVNGDGRPDLILTYLIAESVSTDPSGIAIYLNNGTSDPFGNVTPLRLLVGHSINAIAVGDLNEDGKPDLAVSAWDATLTTGALFVLLNSGSPGVPFVDAKTLHMDDDLGGGCLGVSVADVNGDGLPDLLFSCLAPSATVAPAPANPAVGAIYLNNGTANPFANVSPVDIPGTNQSGYGRSVAVGTLVKNGKPDVLVVADSPGLANYYRTSLDQDPVAQNDSAECEIDKAIVINVLANDSAAPGENLNSGSLTITSAPKHGAATVNSKNGLVTYAPAAGYTGSDGFKYTVRDDLGGQSNVASVAIKVEQIVPTPVFFPAGGTYSTAQSVAIGDSVSGAAIYYTRAGTTPTTASTRYSGEIKVSANETIKAIAAFAGETNSAVASAMYNIVSKPALKLSVTSLSFPDQTVNTPSAAKTITLTNDGAANLSFTSIGLIGSEAHDFKLTTTCATTLAVGAHCLISVTFTPIATGKKTSVVSIADNASGSPQTVSLTGTATTATDPRH